MRDRCAIVVVCLFSISLLFVPHEVVTGIARAEQGDAQPELASILSGSVPASAADLKAMQSHLQALAEKVIPTTVAVQVGVAQGSGVIISGDGYVLTAAHVVGEPEQRAKLILHDGRSVLGTTLGVFRTMDAGLVKITEDASKYGQDQWPHASMGESEDLKPGQWCLATGHPGGFDSARAPVVRVGRILSINPDSAITTDCTLVGGDSGGPLFGMRGEVIGIHSRIGSSLTTNLHVPVHAFQESWERLAVGEAWGHLPGKVPFIGVQGEPESDVAKIARVYRGTPAERAGILPGDVITRFDGKRVSSFSSLQTFVESKQPGTRVKLEVRRGDRRVNLNLKVGYKRE